MAGKSRKNAKGQMTVEEAGRMGGQKGGQKGGETTGRMIHEAAEKRKQES